MTGGFRRSAAIALEKTSAALRRTGASAAGRFFQ
jgi:hypothetical protein